MGAASPQSECSLCLRPLGLKLVKAFQIFLFTYPLIIIGLRPKINQDVSVSFCPPTFEEY